ncbi:serine hydrolase [Flavobacterium noncentrifugens]|uniref:CubicO group peptidase, beta-lactamase class C family n=1 Tax=Flavobacterium noncentrifugens TaxID=1128970 RepID=A0A1G8VZK0_9FLAO|nr:serine hydrolase [Flavobacterium noncentrifugens]GEP50701.1 serine hydrolase [Flavobacterium noncentrifugens]SDJ71277.1 CubicO group peptidase, beta-lactamase class C family [Flavobacterium noncentrifugens]
MKQAFSLFLLVLTSSAFAQISEKQIDELVQKTLTAFDVPGIAVAVVKDGKVVHSKGYGIRSVITKEKVNENTLFGIASNSKAFTSAALGILVDEGKLNWDDKVVKFIPEFKMYNDYVTHEFTIRDLLTHRSGLGLGAGDLMIWPDGNNFTTEDIIRNLQFLKPVSAFRTKYDYDNLLYIVAGEIVTRVSGKSWCDFIESRILKPLEMTHTAAAFSRLKDTSNVIAPHVPTDGKLKVIKRYQGQVFDPAAGIYSSVNDLSKWVIMQLNDGKYGANNQNQLFSKTVHNEMWTSQTILPNRKATPYTSNFRSYGLGWQLTDINGHLQVSHTGGLDGIVTQVLMIPDLNLGIIVLTNQQSGAAFTAISNTIKDSYLKLPAFDHVANLSKDSQQKEDDADKITTEVWAQIVKNQKDKIKTDLKKYTGTFKDNWFGNIELTEKNGKFYFQSERSKQLKGEIFFYKDQTFVVKWDNRSFLADAFLSFSSENNNIKMKPVSPLTDFSYDFQDLDFYRMKSPK